jgi:hypothetical protein
MRQLWQHRLRFPANADDYRGWVWWASSTAHKSDRGGFLLNTPEP